MGTKILIPYGGITLIEKILINMERKSSRPTIRRALSGAKPKKSKEKEYNLIRSIALNYGGIEDKRGLK
ncbi:MAG: hypothetical protein H6Q16_1568 [Bacteroidetes bacterium]|nr:hypothetical protein [Bacteroidota bacterium]